MANPATKRISASIGARAISFQKKKSAIKDHFRRKNEEKKETFTSSHLFKIKKTAKKRRFASYCLFRKARQNGVKRLKASIIPKS